MLNINTNIKQGEKMNQDNKLIKDIENNLEYFNANISYGGHEQLERNERAFNNAPANKYDEQCAICNKGMNTSYGTGYSTRGYMNPLMLVAEKDHNYLETKLSGADMGAYYVGSECGKKIKKALQEANLDWKQYIYYFNHKNRERA